MNNRKHAVMAVATLGIVVLSGCGGNDANTGASQDGSSQTSQGAAQTSPGASDTQPTLTDVKVGVYRSTSVYGCEIGGTNAAGDQRVAFDMITEVPAGKLTVTVDGKHSNVVVIKPGTKPTWQKDAKSWQFYGNEAGTDITIGGYTIKIKDAPKEPYPVRCEYLSDDGKLKASTEE